MTENPHTPRITFGDHLRHVLATANAIVSGPRADSYRALGLDTSLKYEDAVARAAKEQVLAVYEALGYAPSADVRGIHDGWEREG